MKKTLVLLAIATVSLCAEVKAQFNFGVSPGLNLSTAHVGYRFGNFEPTVSFAFLRGSVKYTIEGQEYEDGNLVNFTDEYVGKAGVYLPGIGLKYFMKPVGKLNSYFAVQFVKPILQLSSETDGVSDSEAEDEVGKVNLFGAQLGYGVEYFLDPNFSIGGEFGLLWVKAKYKSTDDVEKYDYTTGDYTTTQEKSKYSFVLNPTYATISLNFYFSKQAE